MIDYDKLRYSNFFLQRWNDFNSHYILLFWYELDFNCFKKNPTQNRVWLFILWHGQHKTPVGRISQKMLITQKICYKSLVTNSYDLPWDCVGITLLARTPHVFVCVHSKSVFMVTNLIYFVFDSVCYIKSAVYDYFLNSGCFLPHTLKWHVGVSKAYLTFSRNMNSSTRHLHSVVKQGFFVTYMHQHAHVNACMLTNVFSRHHTHVYTPTSTLRAILSEILV